MNKIKIILVVMAVVSASCTSQNKGPEIKTAPALEEAQNDTTVSNKSLIALANDKDPVCGMPVNSADVTDTTLYDGKVYGFCSEGCKDDFLKSPKDYIK